LLRDQARLAFAPGSVDGCVDPAVPGDGPVDQFADLVVMTNVGLDKLGFGAEATKFGLKGFAFHLPAAGDHDPSAISREGQGRSPADARQSAGDQNNGDSHDSSSFKTP